MTRPWTRTFVVAIAVVLLPAAVPAQDKGAADDFFTVFHLSDTQYYSQKHRRIFLRQTTWIASNARKEHIAFVTHTGDVVQHGGADNEEEWRNADRALSALDGAVPWGVAPGNHDYDRVSAKVEPASMFVKTFGPARFKDRPWYCGHSQNGLNACQLITRGA